MVQSFSATIDERVKAYKERMELVFRASAQDIAEEVTRPRAKGGNMRVKTGFLRASLKASTSSLPQIIGKSAPPPKSADNSFSLNPEVNLVIASAKLGQTIFLGFTAGYARPREYVDGFVRLAAQNWQKTVDKNAALAIRQIP